MAARVKKEITASGSAKNDQETFTKDEEKQLHLKKNLSQVFTVSFEKFLRTPFLKNIFQRLPLSFMVWYSLDGGFY